MNFIMPTVTHTPPTPLTTRSARLLLDGEVGWVREKSVLEFGPNGSTVHGFGIFQDISAAKVGQEAAATGANHEGLTGLPKSNLVLELLDQAIRFARRSDKRLAVLLVDLDHFRQANDIVGLRNGDLLLNEAAKRIKDSLREVDIVVRLRDDEFVIILHDVEFDAYAGLVSLKLIEALSATFALGSQQANISASVGISIYSNDGSGADTLLRHADLAMYQAKGSGRNTLHFFDATINNYAHAQRQLEIALHEAVVRKEFVLHYQPIYEITGEAMVGVEALIRWAHPECGLVMPDSFITTAEEVGPIREIGLWVIEEVCRQISQWRAEGIHLNVSVNVSARQIPDGLPIEWVQDTLARHGVPTEQLTFEITETVLLVDTDNIQEWLKQIRSMGIKLSLDDFGAGHSSFSYLEKFQMDHIKIDRSFILNMEEDPRKQALIKAIIAMGKALDMSVVAEGIESARVLARLSDLGCVYAQGFLLSRPVPAEALTALGHKVRATSAFGVSKSEGA